MRVYDAIAANKPVFVPSFALRVPPLHPTACMERLSAAMLTPGSHPLIQQIEANHALLMMVRPASCCMRFFTKGRGASRRWCSGVSNWREECKSRRRPVRELIRQTGTTRCGCGSCRACVVAFISCRRYYSWPNIIQIASV